MPVTKKPANAKGPVVPAEVPHLTNRLALRLYQRAADNVENAKVLDERIGSMATKQEQAVTIHRRNAKKRMARDLMAACQIVEAAHLARASLEQLVGPTSDALQAALDASDAQ